MVQEVEKDVKARTKGELGAAKTLCTPFDQPDLPSGMIYAASVFPFHLDFSFAALPANDASIHVGTNLCIDVVHKNSGTVCFASGKPAQKWSYWGRSY